jgi:hypothetical protein
MLASRAEEPNRNPHVAEVKRAETLERPTWSNEQGRKALGL